MMFWLVCAYCSTFRLKIVNEDPWLKFLERGGRVLICGWHQQFFPYVYYGKNHAKYNPSMMASKSLDGEISSGIASQAGCYAVRGSSSRNGGPALREMTNRLKKYRLAIIFPDGPRGPSGKRSARPYFFSLLVISLRAGPPLREEEPRTG